MKIADDAFCESGGVIRYSRGLIMILDREGLERLSCDYYRPVKKNTTATRTGKHDNSPRNDSQTKKASRVVNNGKGKLFNK